MFTRNEGSPWQYVSCLDRYGDKLLWLHFICWWVDFLVISGRLFDFQCLSLVFDHVGVVVCRSTCVFFTGCWLCAVFGMVLLCGIGCSFVSFVRLVTFGRVGFVTLGFAIFVDVLSSFTAIMFSSSSIALATAVGVCYWLMWFGDLALYSLCSLVSTKSVFGWLVMSECVLVKLLCYCVHYGYSLLIGSSAAMSNVKVLCDVYKLCFHVLCWYGACEMPMKFGVLVMRCAEMH